MGESVAHHLRQRPDEGLGDAPARGIRRRLDRAPFIRILGIEHEARQIMLCAFGIAGRSGARAAPAGASPRSEEHTSELQSLMRTPYAVFGWEKQHTKRGR